MPVLLKQNLPRNDEQYSEWWCSMVNGCFILLGATPVENCPLPSEDSYALASQKTLGILHLFQGRLHSAVVIEMQQMQVSTNKQIVSLHLMWKMAATIWRTRNQALRGTTKTERDFIKKKGLDSEILMILALLRENQLPHKKPTCSSF